MATVRSPWRRNGGSPDVAHYRVGYVRGGLNLAMRGPAREVRAHMKRLHDFMQKSDEELCQELETEAGLPVCSTRGD